MFSPASTDQFRKNAELCLQPAHSNQSDISPLFQKHKNLLESKAASTWSAHINSFYTTNNSIKESMDLELLQPGQSLFNQYGNETEVQRNYILQDPAWSNPSNIPSFQGFQLSEEKFQFFAKPSCKNDTLIQRWHKDDLIFRGKFSKGATPKPEKLNPLRLFQAHNSRNKIISEDKKFLGTPIPKKSNETTLYNYPLQNKAIDENQASEVEELDFEKFKTTKFVKTDTSAIQASATKSSHNIAAFVRDIFADDSKKESDMGMNMRQTSGFERISEAEEPQSSGCASKLELRVNSKKCRRKLFNEGSSPTQVASSKKGLLKKGEQASEVSEQLYSNLSQVDADLMRSLNANNQSEPSTVLSSRLQSDYKNIEVIGSGHFGTVYKCVNKIDGLAYAVKSIIYKKKGVSYMNQAINEVQALASLSSMDDSNPNIVRYYNVWIENETIFIVMEYCPSNLRNLENENKPFSDENLRHILRDVCMGLNHLHKQRIVHLDIKPENILHSRTNKYKIADLGLSRIAERKVGEDINEGDSRYLAPELLKDYTENLPDLTKADIFSLGMTIYELITGQELPKNGPEWRDIRSGKLSRLDNLTTSSDSLKSVIRQMLSPNPDERPSAQELLNNWLQSDFELELQSLKAQNELLKAQLKGYEQKLSLRRKMSL